jgi:hypothetical protein
MIPPAEPSATPSEVISDDTVIELFGQITESGAGATKRDVAREVGERLRMSAKQVYEIIERNKLVK